MLLTKYRVNIFNYRILDGYENDFKKKPQQTSQYKHSETGDNGINIQLFTVIECE